MRLPPCAPGPVPRPAVEVLAIASAIDPSVRVTRAQVVEAARRYCTPPYSVRHVEQGRSSRGLDCIGLIVRVAHDLGISDWDVDGYGPLGKADRIFHYARENGLERVPGSRPGCLGEAREGDLVLLKQHSVIETNPGHFAILARWPGHSAIDGWSFIHACVSARRPNGRRGERPGWVVESPMDYGLLRSVVLVWKMPGVE